MTKFLRKNAWNDGGGFKKSDGTYTDLYWYAKAIQIMQARPIKDATSWWFYAAIHGEQLEEDQDIPYLTWSKLEYINSKGTADLNELPSTKETTLFWNQCQHGTWYFAPWHRGYLVAIEVLLRRIIVDQLDGPTDWSLPYWNYLNQSSSYEEYKIPPAFNEHKLPDGSANPLYVEERHGPDADGNIYIVVGNGPRQMNDKCQWKMIYTPTYGGAKTGFNHDRGTAGALEMNPHNGVHVIIGGGYHEKNYVYGLMSISTTAALDPIFFLHHANIDRMWAAWNETGGNSSPSDSNWLAGPTAQGKSRFVMPLDATASPWYYTPKDVENTNSVNYNGGEYAYTYDDLSLTSYDKREEVVNVHHARLMKLGKANVNQEVNIALMSGERKEELVGASNTALLLHGNELQTRVTFHEKTWEAVGESLLNASVSSLPDEVYLHLEEVKGIHDANFLSVYVNGVFIDSVALFGLSLASRKNSPHGGAGMTYSFDITHIIDELHLEGDLNIEALDIRIESEQTLHVDRGISIGRISLYRVKHS